MAGPAGRLDAVLVCGGRWHDMDYARVELLRRLLDHPRVRTTVAADYGDVTALAAADLLVTYTCDVRPTPPQQRALVRFVERGGRWLALHGTHSAIDPPPQGGPRVFRTPRAFGPVADLLGGQFLGHPPIAPYLVEVTAPTHPLVEGTSAFEVSDELYVCEMHGPVEVLLHTTFGGACPGFEEGDTTEPQAQPVLYLRRQGAGEVCYLTLGHCRGRYDTQDLGVADTGRVDRGSWLVPEFRAVLGRCLTWCVDGAAEAAACR